MYIQTCGKTSVQTRVDLSVPTKWSNLSEPNTAEKNSAGWTYETSINIY